MKKDTLIKIKIWTQIILAVVTGLMALFTLMVACETKKLGEETKELRLLDLKPFISPKDIALEFVDKGGTPIRRITQLGLEDYNNSSIPNDDTRHISLSVKFNNSGRLKALIEVEDILCEVYSMHDNNYQKLDNIKYPIKQFIIPGLSDSGWELSFNIKDIRGINSHLYCDYKLYSFSDDLPEFKNSVNYSIFCDFSVIEIIGKNAYINNDCRLVPYNYRKNYNLNDKNN